MYANIRVTCPILTKYQTISLSLRLFVVGFDKNGYHISILQRILDMSAFDTMLLDSLLREGNTKMTLFVGHVRYDLQVLLGILKKR